MVYKRFSPRPPYVMPERTYDYPTLNGETEFCEPSSASGHNEPKRPPPMRPRPVFRVAPIRMRSDIVVYSSTGDMKFVA